MSQWLENNEKILSSFKKNNSFELRKVSGKIISQAALKRDKVLLHQSYVAYALSKLLSKPHYIEYKEWSDFKTKVEEILKQCHQDLKEHDLEKCLYHTDQIADEIEEIDRNFGHYVRATLEKARIRTAAHLYATGLSLKQAVHLTETSELEVLRYVGKTKVNDQTKPTKTISQRIKNIEKIEQEERKWK